MSAAPPKRRATLVPTPSACCLFSRATHQSAVGGSGELLVTQFGPTGRPLIAKHLWHCRCAGKHFSAGCPLPAAHCSLLTTAHHSAPLRFALLTACTHPAHRHTHTRTDRHTYRHTHTRTHRQTDIQTYRHTHTHAGTDAHHCAAQVGRGRGAAGRPVACRVQSSRPGALLRTPPPQSPHMASDDDLMFI